jgi:hypothetical protein
LVGIGQSSVGIVELRRFVELILWTVYFTDHTVEWSYFESQAGSGFAQDTRKPISHAARRELAHYIEYARELMGSEPSGLGVNAVDSLKQCSHELNANVHPSEIAKASVKAPPHDDVSEAQIRKFSRLQHRVFASSCLLLAAYRRNQFQRFDAIRRAHFDWLIGHKLRRRVRQGPFGLT